MDSTDETFVAASLDGRAFTFRDAGPAPFVAGDLVVLTEPGGDRFLGQILEQGPATGVDAALEGHGLLLGAFDAHDVPQRTGRRAFRTASGEPASASHLESLQRASSADLPIGTWTSGGVAVTARLRAQGFGRHTFLCGQSGSGKTYALGVILEQILLGTDLRMVVLDPNADFVRLGEVRPDAPADEAASLTANDIRVLGADDKSAEPLRMRFATMPRQAQAAVLRLDPLRDRAEYNLFLHLGSDLGPRDIGTVVTGLLAGGPDERALGQRIENLGLVEWEVWANERPSASEVMATGARATILDLSGFVDPHEPLAVSLDLVERLWADRESRIPTLIVIDEAHNLCPAEPSGSLQEALVARLIQIAAEGRKYGLWLLLSTQRPSKIHPQVLSQCDNLVLMRMNAPGDVADLADIFGFAPPAMLQASQFFVQGEALVAGGFVPTPSSIRMGQRLTFEGGSDVKVPVTS